MNNLAKPLRVLLDARKFGDGGIGRYLEWLSRGLASRSDISLTAMVQQEQQIPSGITPHEVLIAPHDKYSFAEYWSLLKDVDVSKYDVFHTPHFTLPRLKKIASVVTIHDTIHCTHPSRWYQPLLARALIGSAIKRCNEVITVSPSSRDQIIKLFPKFAHKVTVIGHPPPCWDVSEQTVTEEPYLLCVISQDRAHKGIHDILAVLTKVHSSLGLPVVLAGQGTQSRKGQKIAPNVFILGEVGEPQLRKLYAASSGVVVASQAEGFGFSMIEAKLFKKRVCCRPVPALLEHVSSKDMVAPSMSIDDFAKTLQTFALECVRDGLGDGLDATRYDASTLVSQTIRVYQRAVKRVASASK